MTDNKTKTLEELLESVPQTTPEQREEQRRSFAHGNVSLSNPNVTREMIDRAADFVASCPLGDEKVIASFGYHADAEKHLAGKEIPLEKAVPVDAPEALCASMANYDIETAPEKADADDPPSLATVPQEE